MEKNHSLQFRGQKVSPFIPVAVFLFFCILYFVVFKVFEMYALAMGAFIGLLIGAVFTKKGSYEAYWSAVYKGVCEAVPIAVLLLIIGMFAALMKASNLSFGFVWLANLLRMQGAVFTTFTFIAVCVIATATGSSIGTMFTCFPIFYSAGLLLGCHPGVLAGAIVSGGIFGDNLAPLSDTTIISAGTQEYTKRNGLADIGGCVYSRLRYSLAAAALSLIFFFIFGGSRNPSGSFEAGGSLASIAKADTLVMLIPVAIMLVIAVRTRNIYKAITAGLILGTATALLFQLITLKDIVSISEGAPAGFLTDGISSMMATVILVIAVYGIMGVLTEAGVLSGITDWILTGPLGKKPAGIELAMMIGVLLTTLIFGGVTSASMATFGKIQNELGKKARLHPYRRANLLDGFANSIVLNVPFLSVFVFIGVTLANSLNEAGPAVSALQVASGMFYSFFLFFVLLFSVLTGWGRAYEGADGAPVKTQNQI